MCQYFGLDCGLIFELPGILFGAYAKCIPTMVDIYAKIVLDLLLLILLFGEASIGCQCFFRAEFQAGLSICTVHLVFLPSSKNQCLQNKAGSMDQTSVMD